MNKKQFLERMIVEDKMHQAHPLKELLVKAATINKTFKVETESTEKDCNWTNCYMSFKNKQVVPFYIPSGRCFSVALMSDEPMEFTFNTQAVLSKM